MVEQETILEDGMEFLVGKGLLSFAEKDAQGNSLYGITQEGLSSVYLLALVMASGITSEELKGTKQSADARQVAQCASALVRALDEMAMDTERETDA